MHARQKWMPLGLNSRNYLQGDLLEKLTQDNMTKVMNMMAAAEGPIVVKSHMDSIVFYQLYTLCFGEKWVNTIANFRSKGCFLVFMI